MIAQKAAQNPEIVMDGTSEAVKNNSATFMIMANSPSVRIMIGKDRNLMTGRMKELTIPRTAPARSRSCQFPLKLKPGTRKAATLMAATLAMMCKAIFNKKLI
jgi:hypothetical protein